MVVTVRADEVSLSREEQARIVRRLRLALETFQPRAVRATLRIRRDAEAGAHETSLVQVSVPLGPAGVVRVEARGAGVRSCTETAIRRIVDAVSRRLSLERQQLLEFLFLARGAAPGWPPVFRRAVRRRPRAIGASTMREASRGGAASRRSATPVAA
jgi:hypothetical protein